MALIESTLDDFKRGSPFSTIHDPMANNFSRLNTGAPLSFMAKEPSISKLGGVYWVPKSWLPAEYAKQPWYDQCIIEPLDVSYVTAKRSRAIAHKIGTVDKTYSVVYDSSEYIGLPRFLGISLFGKPSKDARCAGDACEWPEWTKDESRVLRPEQELALKWALDDLDRWGGTFVEADCGVGKTAIALKLCHDLGPRAMFIVPTIELLKQVLHVAKSWCPGIHVGILQGAESYKKCLTTKDGHDCPLVVASIDTLVSAGSSWPKEFFRRFGTIVVDEAHHIAAKCLSQVLPLLPSKNIIGLSATPDRKDGLQAVIHWLLGPLSFRFQRLPHILEITGLPFVPTFLHWITVKHSMATDDDSSRRSPPLVVQQQRLARNGRRDNIILDRVLRATLEDSSRRVLFLTLFCDHADRLYDSLCERGHSSITGLSYGKTVKGIPIDVARFLVRTWQKCGEGFDDKSLTDLVLMLPRSTIQQVVGRVQRLNEGKAACYIWDIYDEHFGDGCIDGMRFSRIKFYDKRGIKSVTLT